MTELECDILAGVRLKYGDTLAELARLLIERTVAIEKRLDALEASVSATTPGSASGSAPAA